MTSDEQRRQLGRFIRSHRESMAPEGASRRRRTPGWRREELAARAGIGVTWCAWIEQGRAVRASPETLARLAAALALTPAERAYLFALAERRDPDAPPALPGDRAPDSVRALVTAQAGPANGLDRCWNACCWNPAAAHLFAGWLSPGRQRNLLRYTFLDESARALLPDWEERALRLLAEFRADRPRALDDAETSALIAGLNHDSPLFASGWQAQAVIAREGGPRRFTHPIDGLLTYRQYTFIPADRPDHKVVTLLRDS